MCVDAHKHDKTLVFYFYMIIMHPLLTFLNALALDLDMNIHTEVYMYWPSINFREVSMCLLFAYPLLFK